MKPIAYHTITHVQMMSHEIYPNDFGLSHVDGHNFGNYGTKPRVPNVFSNASQTKFSSCRHIKKGKKSTRFLSYHMCSSLFFSRFCQDFNSKHIPQSSQTISLNFPMISPGKTKISWFYGLDAIIIDSPRELTQSLSVCEYQYSAMHH